MLPDNILICSEDPVSYISDYLSTLDWSKIVVLVDENTLANCYPRIREALPNSHGLIEIRSGEERKNLETCQHIWQQMTDHRVDRAGLMINLGGGVIGDMGGFCAATYKRGIRFVNIPTTLLAMVDASIGGKLGIDFQGYKNHIGVFKDPEKVVVDAGFLSSLPERELISGYAEVIKHALIADSNKFDELSRSNVRQTDWENIILHSINIKEKVVREDPREAGLRKILNYGHTIGHAIESHYLGKGSEKLLHGEAIAMGMICEAYLSKNKTGLDGEALDRISNYLLSVYQPSGIRTEEISAIATLVIQDKKNVGNTIQAALLEGIGSCCYNIEISREDIIDSIIYYNSLID